MRRQYNQSNKFHNEFHPYFNKTYQFVSNPVAHYMEQQPFSRNSAPLKQNFNEEHWCETCDRGFRSSEILEKHKGEHQKCNIDGCQFIAHPKVITKHIQMQHASGLYKKIAKLNNPEEIKKWREERKRRYPTKLNIEKKAAEIKEKITRGEKMGLNKDRSYRQFNKGPGNLPKKHNTKINNERSQYNSGRKQGKPNENKFNRNRQPVLPKTIYTLPSADNLRKLKPFAGIQDIVMETNSIDPMEETNCNFIIEDDDCGDMPKPVLEKLNDNEPKVCGALSSLMCYYDSSDDDVNDKKIDKLGSKPINSQETSVKPLINNRSKTNVNQSILENNKNVNKSDDEGPEEIKFEKVIEDQAVNKNNEADNCPKKKKVVTEKRLPKYPVTKPTRKIPSTLLQKLLRREVQQERNIVLQCVRHIVKNNFFEK